MNYAIILTDKGFLKSYEIIENKPFEVKDKHLFVGFIINNVYQSPNNSSVYLDWLNENRLQLKGIEFYLMSISNTYVKPQLNEYRSNNEVYDLYLFIEQKI